jgi:OmpA-OmpF porin, OOP family
MSARPIVAAALGTLALLAGAPALAQDATSPLYLGVTYGQAHWRPGCPDSAACDDTGQALRILGGYEINRNFAIEVGFHNLGNISGAGANIKANAWEALLVGRWPLSNAFSVYGKLGAYRGNAKGSGTLLGAQEENYSATWGVGLAFDVNRNIALRAEWQSYPNIGSGTIGPRSDINVTSVGALWRFR